MTFRFDGLHSILGNSSATIPEADAPAVDSTPVAAVAEAPLEAPPAAAPKPAPAFSLRPISSVVDFPDLSDLDRGLYSADGAAVRPSRDRGEIRPDDARVAALGRGLDPDAGDGSSEFGASPSASPRQWGASRTSSNVRRRSAAVQNDHDDASERRIGGWAAVAVVVLGLFLGGAAATASFRDDVSHILASWSASPASSHSLRLQ